MNILFMVNQKSQKLLKENQEYNEYQLLENPFIDKERVYPLLILMKKDEE